MRKKILIIISIMAFFAPILRAEEAKDAAVLKSISFDPKTAAVSYELTHPAKVRIRMGAKDGPLLRTIVDWEERGLGQHKEEWDGLDASGKIKLAGSHDMVFTFNYFTQDDAFIKNVSLEEIMPHPEQLIIGRFLPSLNINRIHKSHNPLLCHDPTLVVRLPERTKLTTDGCAVIKNNAPIVIDLPEKDRDWFTRERYSIHVFIDDVFLAGELEGYSPYNFILNTEKISKGKHLISVNYSGFSDHIGIVNIPVYVEKG